MSAIAFNLTELLRCFIMGCKYLWSVWEWPKKSAFHYFTSYPIIQIYLWVFQCFHDLESNAQKLTFVQYVVWKEFGDFCYCVKLSRSCFAWQHAPWAHATFSYILLVPSKAVRILLFMHHELSTTNKVTLFRETW